MSAMDMPVEVFCSYAPEDEVWLFKLEKHLSSLKQRGLISLWHRRLLPGLDWQGTVDAHLETSSIILLLVSADFFASNYCSGLEMRRALARHDAGLARVIPIIVRAVDWKDAPFAHLQALPTDAKPVKTWRDGDVIFAAIATELRKIIVQERSSLAGRDSISRSALSTTWNVPYARTAFFTGREDDLQYLRDHLQAHDNVAGGHAQAISGLGGIGKTSLAIEYAYRYRGEYATILWAHAEDLVSLNVSYRDIALFLNLVGKESKEADAVVPAVKGWLSAHQDYLLILDNVDDPSILTSFVPPLIGGHVLITTRSDATRRINVASPLILKELTSEQGALFLLHRAGLLVPEASLAQATPEYQREAQDISELLYGLPLALEQAGAYLDETGANLTSYRQTYQRNRTQLLQLHQPSNYPYTVATTWSISFSKVEQSNPAAADLLRFCSFLAPYAIPEALLIAGGETLGSVLAPLAREPYLLDQACLALKAYSLIARDPYQGTIIIHRLVQDIVRDNITPEQQLVWAERIIAAMNKVLPEESELHRHKWWQAWPSYSPHIQACTQLIDKYNLTSIDARQLLNRAGTLLRYNSRHAEAKIIYKRALEIHERVLGLNHPETAAALDNLATISGIQNDYEQGSQLYEQALTIRERVLGPNHPDTASTINGLALLYCNWKHYEASQKMYERALSIRESVLGLEHSETAETLDKLGMLYRIWKKSEQAEQFFIRALSIREHVLGPEDPATASTLNNLGVLYRDQGKFEQAYPLLERAWHMREKTLGQENPGTATTIGNIAYLYFKQGKYEQSLDMYQQALHIREKAFGSDHPKATITCFNIGQLYRKLGAYEQAKYFIERALITHEQASGTKYAILANILEEYAALQRDLGQHNEAAQMDARVQSIRTNKQS